MDAKGLLQFQLNGSFNLLAELAGKAGPEEWTSRSFPGANLVGFTVWHAARTLDWAANCVVRGEPELADRAAWQDLKVDAAAFGAGASRSAADSVARRVDAARVLAYVEALRAEVLGWLETVPSGDLDRRVDLRSRHAERADYATPAVWAEIADLDGIPVWQFLARPCASHVRVHYGEVSSQLEALRAASPA